MYGRSEGDALNDWLSGCEVDEEDFQERQERKASGMAATREQMRNRYKAAKAAAVGAVNQCAFCGKQTVKTTYHKAFCSNGRTRKGGNCKDRYWNSVDRKRRERARQW